MILGGDCQVKLLVVVAQVVISYEVVPSAGQCCYNYLACLLGCLGGIYYCYDVFSNKGK